MKADYYAFAICTLCIHTVVSCHWTTEIDDLVRHEFRVLSPRVPKFKVSIIRMISIHLQNLVQTIGAMDTINVSVLKYTMQITQTFALLKKIYFF